MRKCKYKDYISGPCGNEWYWVDGEAIFLQFGVDYEIYEQGIGNYTTAIIETEDGAVKIVPVDKIKFIKDDKNGLG